MRIAPELPSNYWSLTYTPPVSNISALVQMPLYLIDGNALADAYMRDARAAKTKSQKKAIAIR